MGWRPEPPSETEAGAAWWVMGAGVGRLTAAVPGRGWDVAGAFTVGKGDRAGLGAAGLGVIPAASAAAAGPSVAELGGFGL